MAQSNMVTDGSERSDWYGLPPGPFQHDPGWRQWLWWLGIPFAMAVFLVLTYRLNPGWYIKWVHAEGYGLLELSHFFIPLAGFALAVSMLFDPWVQARRLVFGWLVIMGLGCFYIAGEEHSWGQHFFNWGTPEGWSALNTQDETNLHNVSDLFGKLPRFILEVNMITGGILFPIALRYLPKLRRHPISFFLPASALMATALFYLAFKIWGVLLEKGLVPSLVARSSEVLEFYIYLFLLFYLIVMKRRVREIQDA